MEFKLSHTSNVVEMTVKLQEVNLQFVIPATFLCQSNIANRLGILSVVRLGLLRTKWCFFVFLKGQSTINRRS